MRVLLHICCGPCAIMPIRRLLDEGHEVSGYFYNPNIHPLSEYLRRRQGAAEVAAKYNLPMHWAVAPEDYNSAAWLRRASNRESARCPLCWEHRLERTAYLAHTKDFDAFSTSLLYSRRQQHDRIAALGAAVSRRLAESFGCSPAFLYRDFRADWQAGINESKAWGIYRQQYCGCLFSENERYAKDLQNQSAALLGQHPQ